MPVFGAGKNGQPGNRWRLDFITVTLPESYRDAEVSDLAIDGTESIYLLTRRPAGVVVLDERYHFSRVWPSLDLKLPHGISIDDQDRVYIVDQAGHNVRVFDLAGNESRAPLGSGSPSASGVNWAAPTYFEKYCSIERAAPPFNNPTKAAVSEESNLYVADGYGNARVHVFDTEGCLIRGWGEPGSGAGQFRLPHGLCIAADGRVLVADRENDRIQVFNLNGVLVDIWPNVQRPSAIVEVGSGMFMVAEMAWRRGDISFVAGECIDFKPSGIRIINSEGESLARLNGAIHPGADRWSLHAPHGVAWTPRGEGLIVQLHPLSAQAIRPLPTRSVDHKGAVITVGRVRCDSEI